jgi:hypothetical protein
LQLIWHIKTNIHGITAKSANGNTVFPGKTTAKKINNGTKIKEIARLVMLPVILFKKDSKIAGKFISDWIQQLVSDTQ